MTQDELGPYNTFIDEIADEHNKNKARGHSILNHRDPPKDAVIGAFLSNNLEGEEMSEIIKDLYYLKPTCGICGPGVVGKDHVIENTFRGQKNILVDSNKYPRHALEIHPQSAHGVNLKYELGLEYVFTDAGLVPEKYLGKGPIYW